MSTRQLRLEREKERFEACVRSFLEKCLTKENAFWAFALSIALVTVDCTRTTKVQRMSEAALGVVNFIKPVLAKRVPTIACSWQLAEKRRFVQIVCLLVD